jgi:septum formation protein
MNVAVTVNPIASNNPILLGSASPRRREILESMGLPLVIRPAATPELEQAGDTPDTFLKRVVGEKLAAAEAKRGADAFACVLVADTIVVLDDQILGKPKDVADAGRLVGMLAGRIHRVHTRFAFSWIGPKGPVAISRTVVSSVTMRAAAPLEVSRYAATGEGLDKAGAYAVQGLGAFLVERIDGSYTNVVGLPACELVQELTNAGFLPEFPRLF